jgi:NO-binding membrane sensor protein with MHYT domain
MHYLGAGAISVTGAISYQLSEMLADILGAGEARLIADS